MTNQSEKIWVEDFKEFIQTKGTPVPEKLTQNILSQIQENLKPKAIVIFLKLLGIHAVIGTLSLGICDQFGLNPFPTHFSLADYVSQIHHSLCMTFCGFLFIGLSSFMALVLFNKAEWLVFQKNSFLQIFCLSTISFASFLFFGVTITLNMSLLWFIGAFLGGLTPILIFKLRNS